MCLADRIKIFIDSMGITPAFFEKSCGLSNGAVSKMGDGTRRSTIDKISNTYTCLNTSWLLTGEGEMLRQPQDNSTIITSNNNTYAEGSSGNGNITINHQGGGPQPVAPGASNITLRPLVTKSLASRPNTDVYLVVKKERNSMEQLVAFQQYSDFDFYYQVRQDAMQPLYWQGDVLALAHLEPGTTIIQGAAMVVDTNDFGFLLRNIYDRGDYYECRCVNENSKFESQNIQKSNVIRLYRVVYSVRLGD